MTIPLLSILLLLFANGNMIAQQVVDRIFHHAKIYTVNAAQPWADTMAIKDGSIL